MLVKVSCSGLQTIFASSYLWRSNHIQYCPEAGRYRNRCMQFECFISGSAGYVHASPQRQPSEAVQRQTEILSVPY